MTITRENMHPAYQRELDEEEVMRGDGETLRAQEVTVRQTPRKARIRTYPTPDGPAFVSTGSLAPYGEDPHDPATQHTPRRQSTGMLVRLHEHWKR